MEQATSPGEVRLIGSFASFAIAVNYILGTGALGIPYAFVRAGIGLSLILLASMSAVAVVAIQWLLDVIARAEGMLESKQLLQSPSSSTPDEQHNRISHVRKQENNELCGLFLGERAKRAYEVCLLIYFLGTLWSYAAVFSNSLTSHVPLPFLNGGQTCRIEDDFGDSGCRGLYVFYLFLFALVAVPLTCVEITEQKAIQVALAVFRFVALGLMAATCVAAIWSYPQPDPSYTPATEAPYYSNAGAFNFGGLGVALPVMCYSQIVHHSIPGLVMPVREKRKAAGIFTAVIGTTFTFYALLGVTAALCYGTDVQQTASVNWSSYTGRDATSGAPWWASIISYVIVLFPAVDILSCFPLNAITLGNNLLQAFVPDKQRAKERRVVIFFRLAAAIPPIIGACFEANLDDLLKWTGSLGIIIAFVFPALLSIASSRRVRLERGTEDAHVTPYTIALLNDERFVVAMLVLFVVLFVSVIGINISDVAGA